MRTLSLTKGEVSILDDVDFERVSEFKWCYLKGGYAVRGQREGAKTRMIFLHRFLTNASKGQEVDHINGDKLDNRRSNLRICTSSQNKFNKSLQSNNTSGYKGVSWNKDINKWVAQIWVNNKKFYIGVFTNKLDAALGYNEVALRLHGEFALTNQL